MKNSLRIVIDFAFKHIFAGNGEVSEFILIDLLNSILGYSGEDKIVKVTYLNPFNDRERDDEKLSIMDIKVETERKERIDIEIQINDADDYRKRSLYYWSKLYTEGLKKGNAYFKLKKSIVINILDFDLLDETKKYHNIFTVMEVKDNFLLNNDMHIHYIELPKFDDSKAIELMSDLEKWVTFIKDYGKEEKKETIEIIAKRKESIHMAKELADKLSQDEIEYQRYLAREKAIMDEISKREYNKMQLEEMKKREEQALEAEKQALEAQKQALEAEQKAKESEQKAKEAEQKAKEAKQKALEEKEKLEKENDKLQQEITENIKNNISLLKELGIVDEMAIAEKLNIAIERVRELNK